MYIVQLLNLGYETQCQAQKKKCRAEIVSGGRPRPAPPTGATTLPIIFLSCIPRLLQFISRVLHLGKLSKNLIEKRHWPEYCHLPQFLKKKGTVEPLFNEVLGTMKMTLLYQVSRYITVKKQRNIKSWDQQNDLIRGFCYIRHLYNEVLMYFLYWKSYVHNKLLACPIRATVLSWSFIEMLARIWFLLAPGGQPGKCNAYVAPYHYLSRFFSSSPLGTYMYNHCSILL